jgi:uncharacterized protein (TIGR03083 family)
VEYVAQVDALEREIAGLIDAVAAGPLEARVPTCPEFTVDGLAVHVGTFCGWWTHNLCEGTGRPKTPFADDVGPEGRVEWLHTIAGHLVTELRATPPDTVVWTWHPPDQSAAFVARRTSHELAIHRVDAQLARGAAKPVDPELAADGIEEVFLLATSPNAETRVGSRRAARPSTRTTLHLHGTDYSPAEWFLTLERDGITVTREHAKGHLALKGRVSDLEMLLYQRPTVGEVDRFGDESVLAAFHREFTFV